MSACFSCFKLRFEAVGKLKQMFHFTKSCSSRIHSDVDDEKVMQKGGKWGYISHGVDTGKQDKDAIGLYHLSTIHLPEQLEKSLNKYLKNFPSKSLVKDAFQLSKHLQNRGRPTERTWNKYKEAKTAKKIQEDADVNTAQNMDILELGEASNMVPPSETRTTQCERLKPTKKPKLQEYKVVRYRERETAAYAADRIPATYGATLRVLHEIAKREREFKPETILDFGSGLGTATWAAHGLWKDSIKIHQCVDISQDMNKVAESLLRGSETYRTPHFIPRVYFKEYLPVSDKVTYDVVIASYSLSEIPFRKTRKAILENLWGKTNHFMVIVEKGNNEGFDITMEARDLVESQTEQQDNSPSSTFDDFDGSKECLGERNENLRGYVFSPCPHDLTCPRSDVNKRDHPCNFEQRVQLSFAQRRTSLKRYGYYNEMFSYLVLRKAERGENELNWPRILRPVRLRKRHVICNFCSKNGSLQQKTLTKRKNSEIYKCLRHRTKWGDLLPLDEPTANEYTEQQK